MKKILIVAKKEFTKNVKKIGFWISTFLPVLIMIIFGSISYFSTIQTEKNISEKNEKIKNVYIYDESGIIKKIDNGKNIVMVSNYDEGYNGFIGNKENIFIHYKKDLAEKKDIDLFVNGDGLASYGKIAEDILKQSITEQISQKDLLNLYTSTFKVTTKAFEDGKEIPGIGNKTIISSVGALIFFFIVTFSSSSMLTSLTQEKENRTIEVVLSSVSIKDFIVGKVLGLLSVTLFQFFLISILPIIGLIAFRDMIPQDIYVTLSTISVFDWIMMLFYIICGVLISSCIMVAIGGITSNSKEAANYSSPIILLSLIPIYLAGIITSNPKGGVSLFFSYFPNTSSIVLLFRSGADSLFPVEKIIAPVVSIFYVIIIIFVAKKIFEMGVFESNKKFSFKNIFRKN
ncbi:ABC transporter permease [Candidatus Gracilibacteria bacterium]|nr:MAG: ABC transporter permease [Candidatus Gracilibacteria bacterium]